MPKLGNAIGGNTFGHDTMAAGTMRGTIVGRFSQPGWLTWVRGRFGKNTSTNATAEIGVYEAEDGTITNRVADTSTFNVTSLMVDRTGGAVYGEYVTNLDAGFEDRRTGYKIKANQDYALVLRAAGAPIMYGQDHSGEKTHYKSGSSFPSPYAASEVSSQGRMNLEMEIVTNRPPYAPVIVEPQNGWTVSDTTPTIRVRHSDPDEEVGDSMSAYRIEIRDGNTLVRTSGKVPVNQPIDPSGRITVASYTPSQALPTGKRYQVRAVTYDQHDVRSIEVFAFFTVSAGGAFAGATVSPTAGSRRDDAIVTNSRRPTANLVWTHTTGVALNQITARIMRLEDVLVDILGGSAMPYRGEQTLAVNVANGGSVAFPYDSDWTDLAAGGTIYVYQVRGRGTDGSISPWISSAPFVVNASPQVTNKIPTSGTITGQPPVVIATVTDASDDPETLAVEIGVSLTPVGNEVNQVFTVPATYQGNNQFAAALSNVQMPVLGNYDVSVSATDPWGVETESFDWAITLVAPPVLTLTNPADDATITTATPTITGSLDRSWSFMQVTIRGQDDNALYWQSNELNDGGSTFGLPVGAMRLKNALDYEMTLDVETTDGLRVVSVTQFRVEYPQPAAMTGVTLTMERASIYDIAQPEFPEHRPNARIEWNRVSEATVPADVWLGQTVRRSDGESWFIPSRDQTVFVDPSPSSNVPYTWAVSYAREINNGFDVIESAPAEVSGSVVIQHTIITSENPDDPALTLHWWDEREVDPQRDKVLIPVMGKRYPATFQGPTKYDVIDGTFLAMSDASGQGAYSAHDMANTARLLSEPIIENDNVEIPRQLIYRDPYRPAKRVTVTDGPREQDRHDDGSVELRWVLTEVG